MTDSELKKLAKQAALNHCKDHDYLPDTMEKAVAFEPHEWVLEAMRAALYYGAKQGAKEQRTHTRKLLELD